MTGVASEDNILGNVTPDTDNIHTTPRPDVDGATPDGLAGDSGNGKSCVLHDNQASLYDMEKRANVFALKARRAGMAYHPEPPETHPPRDALLKNRRTHIPPL